MDDAVPHRTLYREVAARLTEMVTTAGFDLGVPVRGCPGWSASDMLGHLVGITQDWVSGRLDHYGSPDWTSQQVRRHSATIRWNCSKRGRPRSTSSTTRHHTQSWIRRPEGTVVNRPAGGPPMRVSGR